jgi:hypothetical protein
MVMLRSTYPLESIGSVGDAWGSVSPLKSFFGMTLEQYREAVKPVYDLRAEIAETEKRLKSLKAKRKDAEAAALQLSRNVVQAVKADPTEGENSPLYAAMGYVRRSERSSGLTRARTPAPAVKKEENNA